MPAGRSGRRRSGGASAVGGGGGATAGGGPAVGGDVGVRAASGITPVVLTDVAAGSGGFKITGEETCDHAGYSVSSAGDVNGDGFADLIVGALGNDAGGNYAGAAYVVFGAAGGISSVDLDAVAAGAGGFKITGEYANDRAGFSVSSAGDVHGDGFADLIVGAADTDEGGNQAGAAYVVFGAASGIT